MAVGVEVGCGRGGLWGGLWMLVKLDSIQPASQMYHFPPKCSPFRIWSGRVITERKAWELLSIVDQIHEWGVTAHRDFVIRHLKAWHEFGRRCYFHDASAMHYILCDGKDHDGRRVLRVDLPAWTQHLTTGARARFKADTTLSLDIPLVH
ncbi:hypothetical protein B0T18DRAFT_469430 [Schizothecium vesticola]|uniref:Uncharacterized protein n=1 Tax=Schizothecium vesticola TaxID=314040 RepID=A0AA40EQV6_9PEZI|nr:hypothetical protein B0T18DRAFT_469430 [Schizothecium vesticola]